MTGHDTIFALSSGSVPAGVAVVRMSGPRAAELLVSLCGELPEPRRAVLRVLRDVSGDPLDRGLVLWMPAPASFTGEDVAELHLHGSVAVVRGLFDSLTKRGARFASPGEFSRRAFDNAKLDLTQIEGLSDLIHAETETQRTQALRQASGELRRLSEEWRRRLIGLRAELEARLDFSDEGDVEAELPDSFCVDLAALRVDLEKVLRSAESGERIRHGFRVALLGRPNAGKSSLLNVIAQRDVAIVTAEPGTTRDVLEVSLDLGGYSVVVSDTAGLREASSEAERLGIDRARRAAAESDLVLWLQECGDPDAPPELPYPKVLRIWSKADLRAPPSAGNAVSAVTGEGLDDLLAIIRAEAAQGAGTPAVVTRERQRLALEAALGALAEVERVPEELAADLLRIAGDAMARLAGRVDVEDVLEHLFAEFCIGK